MRIKVVIAINDDDNSWSAFGCSNKDYNDQAQANEDLDFTADRYVYATIDLPNPVEVTGKVTGQEPVREEPE